MSPAETHLKFTKATLETQRQLSAFAEENPSITLAVLAAEDGMALATHPARHTSTQRLAAMSSSLNALASALVREAGFAESRNLIVESEGGVIIVVHVPGVSPRVSLAVVANASGVLGQLLWASRNCCAALKDSLQVS